MTHFLFSSTFVDRGALFASFRFESASLVHSHKVTAHGDDLEAKEKRRQAHTRTQLAHHCKADLALIVKVASSVSYGA
jgi:hypothetical protein